MPAPMTIASTLVPLGHYTIRSIPFAASPLAAAIASINCPRRSGSG